MTFHEEHVKWVEKNGGWQAYLKRRERTKKLLQAGEKRGNPFLPWIITGVILTDVLATYRATDLGNPFVRHTGAVEFFVVLPFLVAGALLAFAAIATAAGGAVWGIIWLLFFGLPRLGRSIGIYGLLAIAVLSLLFYLIRSVL